jgi:hypothetical protein
MLKGCAMKRDPHQLDLWLEPVFPTRMPARSIDIVLFRAKLKRAMAQAIRECPHDRPTIAARMAQYLGIPAVSKAMIDAYTAESNLNHDISLVRFKGFVHATGAVWRWDMIVSEDGLLLLQGDEARLAEIARLQQEQRELAAKLKPLLAVPVVIKRGGRS